VHLWLADRPRLLGPGSVASVEWPWSLELEVPLRAPACARTVSAAQAALSPADAIVGDSELRSGQFARALNLRKRMELVTTKMLESDIANPAISGLRWPVAANGIAATL
jgi:hypothetical protein